ncbi:carbohydrate ABC transporter permease [Naasia sp. SYSU D00057]|uniref:carbohydrate ABC transporter permease n=1 Tax=Naasia sp. SYSU D00057 TaxID=2817380 RepID=UPI001B317722|nr:carbohydrate ABC transporter permease [Naasia sp. SYSU D00057]
MTTTDLLPPDVEADPGQPRRGTVPSRGEDNPMRAVITSRGDRILVYVLLIAMGLVFAFPLYAMVAKSLQGAGIANYTTLLTQPVAGVNVLTTYLNSFVIGLLHAALVVGIGSMAGYALSKLHFRGRELAFALIILFLAVPGTALLIPVFHITNEADLFNNYLGVALPEAVLTIPFAVLLLRNYGHNLDDSLFEAARMDGAGHFRVFWHIFLPMTRPAIANLLVLCMIWSLQDFLWPSMLFTNPGMTTAAQAVSSFANALGRSAEDFGRYNASLVLLAVPAVLFVLFGLRFIVNGFASGSSKE